MYEARKAALAAPQNAAAIYHASIVGGIFYITMEYIKGSTLKETLRCRYETLYDEGFRRIIIAQAYIDAVRATTRMKLLPGDPDHSGYIGQYTGRADFFHGDPHWSNFIYTEPDHTRGKFVDFGASRFISSGDLERRHWSVIEEQIDRIFSLFPNYESTKQIVSNAFPEKTFVPRPATGADFYSELMMYMTAVSNGLPDKPIM